MAVEIKVPAVGESITEVTVGEWLKKEGDTVKVDDVLCTLDSDKASFELPAETEGVLHILAQAGDTLPIGAVICTIEPVGASAPAPAPAPEAPKAQAPAPQPTAAPAPEAPAPAASGSQVIEMKVPAVGESITEVTIASWSKKDGDVVALDEVLCELESDKATFELPAEAAGTLRIVAQAGETLPIGGLIARIETGTAAASAAPAPSAPAPAAQPAATPADANGQTGYAAHHASPAAAKILAEKGVEATAVTGTGVGGRITKEDAMNAQKAQPAAQPAPAAPAPKPAASAPAPAPVAAPGSRNQRREKMTSLRRTIARRLVAVKNETAMLTTFNEVDMKPIMDMRGKYKDKFKEKHGVGLGFMSFFTKAVCVALKEFPAVNAMIDGDQIVFNDFCDISIAVSSERGLVVPVIRNAEQMTFHEIEKEIVRLAGLARDNKLTIEQMQGGTFTITNGGIFGSMLSTPIINAPQSAILGMHNIVERPVVQNGEIVVRPIMYVALSYDHRIIDGKESVSFLVRIKQLLEDPTRLLLDV
ncbi:2-oxoglutarate dehydrogenase complex dihydrolipoyllysine-residue succinyltransferase [Rudanella paleaurantiibacter]|uniref:Dihydrolipoyllysine-residue succinyltransferase component of 2-oxoglutarate dehydrogenase complex n=1 Tax=Rudanella paleaurantiibacter TaxID=2614655 RepID=A0A7J5U2T2_9BACT|nr:2-oxoglutarate dehydrogenase complex dihydrolipoyllysine-residue succinyltransferase [Rudanella paleaurantiibacter]KAB7732006.1 2-oxoglutarate dehydrogenase complex dihydrolipoyllysine-residue succinyltransferase [Rudanella paleaurantiibacter]